MRELARSNEIIDVKEHITAQICECNLLKVSCVDSCDWLLATQESSNPPFPAGQTADKVLAFGGDF